VHLVPLQTALQHLLKILQLLTILSLLVAVAVDGTGVRVVVLEVLELLLDFLLQAVLQSLLLLALGVVVAQVVVLQTQV
jgi:hypothetical protein